MTVGQAIEQADELRPNNQFTDSLKQSWLHQCDCPDAHEHCAAQPDGGL